MPDEKGLETDEEAAERVSIVRSTQIFGDTPTDPTIGDVVVPAHDEEAANVAAAEVAARDEDGDEDAAGLSQEEAKRQLEPLSADDVQEGAEAQDEAPADAPAEASADAPTNAPADGADSDLAKDKVAAIEEASSHEEVNQIAADDDRVTVQQAADAKREELDA